jgi:formamidopyrimidine-DNA glycosylase
MPELPEVETVRLGLRKLIIGKQIDQVEYDWPKSFPNDQLVVKNFLYDSKIKKLRRRAKVLMIDLDSDYSLVIHLKMTGQIVFRSTKESFGAGHPSDSLVNKLPDKSTRVTINFKDGSKLFFNDQRKFGWMRLMPTSKIKDIDFFKHVGPEPLEPSFTAQVLKSQLNKRPNLFIKAALLDQTVVAGIGNIYADESLWLAKIHPSTRVKDLKDSQIKKLHKSITEVLNLSLKKGGSSDKNYVNAKGEKGSYLNFANVFRRENQPCLRCGTNIQKIKLVGRGTHFCPKCQIIKT